MSAVKLKRDRRERYAVEPASVRDARLARDRANHRARYVASVAAREPRFGVCAQCGSGFVAVNANQVYCDAQCNKAAQRMRAPERPCPTCGQAFRADRGTTYCSLKCRPHAYTHRHPLSPETLLARRLVREAQRTAARRAAKALAALADIAARTRACESCGAMFVGERWQERRFCSKACAATWKAAQTARRREAVLESSLGHGALTCTRCQVTFDDIYPNTRFCSHECRDAAHRGRGAALLRRRGRDKVRRLRPLVLERDGYVCGICRLEIRRDVDVLHPLALTLDHIVPLAAGGSDRLDNLQPAHRMCNVEKGDDLPAWWIDYAPAESRLHSLTAGVAR